MHIPVIKTDPNRPHHYLIGVRINDSIWSDNIGKLRLSYGPIYFKNKDVEDFKSAIMLSKDKLLHTTIKDALEIHGCSILQSEINAMKLAIVVNKGSLHHFSLEEKLIDEGEWFDNFVDMANTIPRNKQQLKEAKIWLMCLQEILIS